MNVPAGRSALGLGALVLVVCATAGAAPPDSARIVEHVSVAGVKLGASRSSVTKAWGPANGCLYAARSWISNPGVLQCAWGARGQRPAQLEAEFVRSTVYAIHVRLIPNVEGGFPNWKTTKGIALGATSAALRTAYGDQLREAAGIDGRYGNRHSYLSKQVGESVTETRFTFPPSYEREQGVREIALYDLDARDICGTVDGPRWKSQRSSYPTESGTRYLVTRDGGYRPPRVTCTFARSWAVKLMRQRPRKLYPTSSSSNFLAGPTRPKKYICSGRTGGRGDEQDPNFVKLGPWPVSGSCNPYQGQGFDWRPDRERDHEYDGE